MSAGVSNAERGRHWGGSGGEGGRTEKKGSFLEPATTPVYVFQSFITFAI